MKNKRYSVQEYANLYDTNKMRVYRLIKSGLIKVDKGKPVKIPDSDQNRKVMFL